MGRNAQVRRARREQIADDRFMSLPAKTEKAPVTLKCVICEHGWNRISSPVVYSPAGSPPIGFNRRHYCAEHLSVYLLARKLRQRGMSKRDAAAEVLRIVAGQKAVQVGVPSRV